MDGVSYWGGELIVVGVSGALQRSFECSGPNVVQISVRLAAMASSHDDEAQIELYHHSEFSDAYAGDAIFRALARPVRTQPERTPSWDAALALSQGRREVAIRRRVSELLTTLDRIAREYLVARRMSRDPTVGRNWAQTWAREQHPERCHSRQAEASFLRRVR